MNQLIVTKNDLNRTGMTIGEIANEYASQAAFNDYRQRKAANTVKRQDSDLALFTEYLAALGDDCAGDFTKAENWHCVTWGLVEGFIKWQLNEGYSVGSINVRLSTIKAYSKLAVKAGVLPVEKYAMIKMVSGYSRKEGRNIDEARTEAEINTRIDRPGAKKAEHTSITKEQANTLKLQPDTPQGRRDSLLMCILLDHGLRCGEVALLTVGSINLSEGTLTFYRPKVDNNATHKLSLATSQAAKNYLENEKPDGKNKDNRLLLGSRKGGKLTNSGMSDRAITKRVNVLGEAVGIKNLSAHDCRHYAATNLAQSKGINELMDIFGWSSPAMAVRYVEAAKVVEVE